MKNKFNTAIGVGAALIVVGFLLFGNLFIGLFVPRAGINVANMIQSGVERRDITAGTGAEAAVGDKVTVHYVGTLPDGKVFDSSRDRGAPFTFSLGRGEVIRGWDEGVLGMRVGGTRRLTIAPDYGYGERAIGPIPANSVLIFEVELLGVEKPE